MTTKDVRCPWRHKMVAVYTLSGMGHMAAGDATKVWFKHIEAHLIARWHDAISCDEISALAAELTASMRSFRDQNKILPAVYYCRNCETSHRAEPPIIYGGSILFAARRLGLTDDTRLSELKVQWDRFAAAQRRAKARRMAGPIERAKNIIPLSIRP